MTKLGKNLKLNEQSDKQYSKELIQTQNTHIYIALSWVFNFQCFTWEKDLFFHKLMIWEIKSHGFFWQHELEPLQCLKTTYLLYGLDNVDVPMWTSWTTWMMLGNPTVTVLLLFLLSWKHFRNQNGGKTALLGHVCGPLPKMNFDWPQQPCLPYF